MTVLTEIDCGVWSFCDVVHEFNWLDLLAEGLV